jgi:hypothetical protein
MTHLRKRNSIIAWCGDIRGHHEHDAKDTTCVPCLVAYIEHLRARDQEFRYLVAMAFAHDNASRSAAWRARADKILPGGDKETA